MMLASKKIQDFPSYIGHEERVSANKSRIGCHRFDSLVRGYDLLPQINPKICPTGILFRPRTKVKRIYMNLRQKC